MSSPTAVTPETFVPHPLHGSDRVWQATNCYVDLWIELLALSGWPPEPAGVCALSADCLPREWSFLKYQLDDLRTLYGVAVAEIDVWRPVEDHVVEHLAVGDLVTLETDAWFLPDTEGISYRGDHTKTTIVPLALDAAAGTLTYLHNEGLFALSGADLDGALARPGSGTQVPMPYMERVRFARADRDLDALAGRTLALAREHLARRPADNPVTRLAAVIAAALPELTERGMPHFHAVSFATTRQLGVCAQNAADALAWLASRADGVAGGVDAVRARSAADGFADVSAQAKKVQFGLARVASGRPRDLTPALAALAEGWAAAMDLAVAALS